MDDSTSSEMDDFTSSDADSCSDMLSSDDEYDSLRHDEHELEDIMAMTFYSEESGLEFYNNYAKCVGFSTRKDIVRRDSKTNAVVHRRFLCSNAGTRNSIHFDRQDRKYRERDMTRCGCEASLSIRLDPNTNIWFVYDFYDAHNHQLAPSDLVTFLRSHRRMNPAKKHEVLTCLESGMRKGQTMNLMECQQGGYEKVGFISKDLYNFSSVQARELIADGDAQTVISYMTDMRQEDCEFFFKYTRDANGCLTNLFWADSQSILDYVACGDVLLFDSTYRTNRYGMPFIPFIGVNHHRKTTLFGCGLVSNESTETYKWLLSSFLEAMCQKPPKSVITDGDTAMREAIISILPSTTHRLCAWHITRNLTQNIKDPELMFKFKVLIYHASTPDTFEEKWKQMVIDHKIGSANKWFNLMYTKKELWAAAYLRGKYFLGMVSTQRSESMNAVFHRHLDRRMNLLNMVKHYERCLSHMRRNEAHDDCIASQSLPVTKSSLRSLEQHAAMVYTPNVFRFVQNEIFHEIVEPIQNVCLQGDGQNKFELGIYSNPEDCVIVVSEIIDETLHLSCECLKWQSEGIPCRHLFTIMKYLNLTEIPRSCILKRWTKNVKIGFPSFRHSGLYTSNSFSDRYRHLKEVSDMLMFNAAKKEETYFALLDKFNTELTSLKDERDIGQNTIDLNLPFKRQKMRPITKTSESVLDPCVVSTKGAPRRRIKSRIETRRFKCGFCKTEGHTRRKCPKLQKQSARPDQTS